MICKYKDKQINSYFFVQFSSPPQLGLRTCQDLNLFNFLRTVDRANVNAEKEGI